MFQLQVSLERDRYDYFSARALARELAALPGADAVRLDFGRVRSLDAAAIGIMLRALRRARRTQPHCRIEMANLSPLMLKVFKICRFDTIFTLEAADSTPPVRNDERSPEDERSYRYLHRGSQRRSRLRPASSNAAARTKRIAASASAGAGA